MCILVIGCVLIGMFLVGMFLGQFFKWFILGPASGLAIVLILANPANMELSLLGSFLQFVVLNTSLQTGYVVGLVARKFYRSTKHSKSPDGCSLDETRSRGSKSRSKQAA